MQAENERLRRQLDEATRARKRQGAPFAKGRRGLGSWRLGGECSVLGGSEELRVDLLSCSCNCRILSRRARMMACASGVWRAINSSVISSDIPFMLGKSRRVARTIP
jgi:hypothetical protein